MARSYAAAQEERLSRKKFDAHFPANANTYCLKAGGNLRLTDMEDFVFYDKPLIKFDRLLETYLGCAPRGYRSFAAAMPVWLREKLNLKSVLTRELAALAGCKKAALPPLRFT